MTNTIITINYTIQSVSRKYSTKSIDSQTTCPYSLQTHYHSCTFPPPQKKTRKKQKQKRLCPSIHPFIHLSIHQSIGGPITPFISYPYICIDISLNQGPMTKTTHVAPPKNRWCESFNLAYHLGKPPRCWSRCHLDWAHHGRPFGMSLGCVSERWIQTFHCWVQ